MSFIETIPEEQASGATARMYDKAKGAFGYVPNMTKAFSHRPDVMDAWSTLADAIKGNMDLRRYEIVTLAAAKELRSSYCMLAHGSHVQREFYEADELLAIVEDSDHSALNEADKAIVRFARKVILDATSITPADVETLRRHGLGDGEIFDVAAAAAVRCFFSKALDALGAQPDRAYNDMDDALRDVLTRGRPIET